MSEIVDSDMGSLRSSSDLINFNTDLNHYTKSILKDPNLIFTDILPSGCSEYPVTLTVNNSSEITKNIILDNTQWTADLFIVFGYVITGTSVLFFTNYDQGGCVSNMQYTWDLGDSSPIVSGEIFEYDYGTTGTWNVTCSGLDDLGRTASLTRTVTIS